MDFTLSIYEKLLHALLTTSPKIITFYNFLQTKQKIGSQSQNKLEQHHRSILNSFFFLRHDVDRKPSNALKLAILENYLGIKGSYYFRIVPESFDTKIMTEIAKLGHEIGYHYEDVDLAYQKLKTKSARLKIN